MAASLVVRSDYTGSDLRAFARRSDDAQQVRRLLAMASILDGGRRSDAAKIGGVTLQIVRDWVIRFNAEGPDGLKSRKAPGKPSILGDEQRRALAAQVEAGPIPSAHGVVRWRLVDLAQWVWDEFGLSISPQSLSREMRALGYRKLSARPRHNGQKTDDIADFKKLRHPPCKYHRKPAPRNARRIVVAGRGADRPADQIDPALGQARHPALRPKRSASILGLDLRSDLPVGGQGGRHRHAGLQQRGDDDAPRGNRLSRRARRTCRGHSRSGRMAWIGRTGHSAKHHPDAAAATMS